MSAERGDDVAGDGLRPESVEQQDEDNGGDNGFTEAHLEFADSSWSRGKQNDVIDEPMTNLLFSVLLEAVILARRIPSKC